MPILNKNYLPSFFYTVSPTVCKTVLTKEQLHETLLATDGFIMIHGECWDIQCKDLGADVFSVWLKKQG